MVNGTSSFPKLSPPELERHREIVMAGSDFELLLVMQGLSLAVGIELERIA